MLRLPRPDALLVGLTLLLKAAVLAIGAAAYVVINGAAPGPLELLEAWNRWDAPHYLDLAVFGYRAEDPGNLVGPDGYRSVYPGDLPLYIVFYPLYPWLVAGVDALVGQPLLSAFIVTGVASLFVAPLLYRLVRHEEGHQVALRSAWFLLIFPTAYFLHIGYTEALFLALVLGSFLAARTERWWLAGILGGLAALTRINGLILVVALAAEAATQWREAPPGRRRLRPEWLSIGLVLVGFGGYLALNQAVYGDPFTFLEVQREHWFKEAAPPWDAIEIAFRWFSRGDFDNALMYGAMELLFVAIGLAGTVVAALRFRPSWFAWMAANLLLFTSTAFLSSVPRYSLTLFPLMVALALPTHRRWLLVVMSAASLAGFAYFAGRFASYAWAF